MDYLVLVAGFYKYIFFKYYIYNEKYDNYFNLQFNCSFGGNLTRFAGILQVFNDNSPKLTITLWAASSM